jgi:hypothetical protein
MRHFKSAIQRVILQYGPVRAFFGFLDLVLRSQPILKLRTTGSASLFKKLVRPNANLLFK